MRDGSPSGLDPENSGASTHEREQAALDRLTRLGGTGLASDLVAIYLDEMPARLAAARAALAAGDASALADVAHAMKSSSAQLGAVALADACETTETAAERDDLSTASECFQSVEAHYATFSAWLAARTAVDPPPVEARARRSTGPIIAVVEDNADNRLLVDAILGDRFELHEYATGLDALSGVRARRPDLIILDVSLPGMDGLEVLARLRADLTLRAIPVVALTAHAMAGDREQYIAAGFDDYVAKPIVDEEVLIRAIERLLARDARRARDTHDARPSR